MRGGSSAEGKGKIAHPLVKTFSAEVLPQAPSPLLDEVVRDNPSLEEGMRRAYGCTHSSTILR